MERNPQDFKGNMRIWNSMKRRIKTEELWWFAKDNQNNELGNWALEEILERQGKKGLKTSEKILLETLPKSKCCDSIIIQWNENGAMKERCLNCRKRINKNK